MEKAVVYQQRLSKLRAYLNDKKTDVALISPGANLYYLTGLPMGMDERLQLLIIFADGRQVLVLPALYRNMVEQLWPASDLVVWDDQTKPEQLLLAVLGGCHRAAVDEQMWAGHLLKLLPILADADLIPLAEVLGEGRMHKDSLEIMKMEQSSAIVDQAFVAVLPDIKAGITEQQLAFRLEILCRELGAEEMNFSMVGFGKNGADPHHRPDNTPLTKNTMIVMDFGCK
ncbi:MAG: aminopeptidase P family N-terminal domain-containing protein, partial [Clostridiales bacterium]